MSSGMYQNGLAALMRGDVDLINDKISCLLLDLNFYTPDLGLDKTQVDIPEDAYLSEVLLTNTNIDVTSFRADSAVFTALSAGKNVGALVVFKDTGVYDTSILLCFVDNAPELPLVTDGTDVVINWDTGVNGIFKL